MMSYNIYMTGVGGQGIGLISEVLLRACDYAGHRVKGVDTHGLAQRGGIVVSQLRLGPKVHSPLIPQNSADLVIALERHEALRGLNTALKDNGTLVYYNTVWQPLDVRLGHSREVRRAQIKKQCEQRQIRLYEIYIEDLEDSRMQNIVVLAVVDREKLVPGVETEHYHAAIDDLMTGDLLQKNLNLFEMVRQLSEHG